MGGKSDEIEPPNPDINDYLTLNLSILTIILKLNYLNYTNGFHKLNISDSILSGLGGSLRPEFATTDVSRYNVNIETMPESHPALINLLSQ